MSTLMLPTASAGSASKRRMAPSNLSTISVMVNKSVHKEERSDNEEKGKDKEDSICQLLNLKDGISVQRQVLHTLALDV